MIGLPDSEVILGTIESVTRHNLKHEILTADEIKRRFPLLHVLPSEIGNKT
jgi:sarcosine oxidase